MAKKKNTKKTVVGIVVGVLSLIATVGALSKIVAEDEKTKVLKVSDYQVCLLDDTTGKADEDDKGGISTTSYYKLEDLESIEIADKDMDVKYYVNVYDEDKIFMQVDEYMEDLTASDKLAYENLGAVYFKIEIVDPDDDEISWFEKFSLVEAIEVTLDADGEEEETDDETGGSAEDSTATTA